MFLFRKNLSLTMTELHDIKTFFQEAIERMLITKEKILHISKRYDMVLICSWEGNYLVMDVYQYSKFTKSKKKEAMNANIPFYTAARSLYSKKEVIVYHDTHKEMGLMLKNLQAFYYICELLRTLNVHVSSSQEYKCVWEEVSKKK